MFIIKELQDSIIIQVKVIPASSRSMIAGIIDGALKIKLNSPPIEGKANKECVVFLSKLLKIPKSSIEIIKGDKNKLKTLTIKGNTEELKDKIKNLNI